MDWKRVLEMDVNKEFSGGVREKGLKLISENGSQPTSISFMKDMVTLGIELRSSPSMTTPREMQRRSG